MKVYIILFAILMLACNTVDSKHERSAIPKREQFHQVNSKVQIAKVEHSISGCFGGRTSELMISAFDSGYLATFKRIGKPSLEKLLTATQFHAFQNFIGALKKLTSSSVICTTSESFKVTYKNQVFERSDEACDFDGYVKLLPFFNFSCND